MGNVVAVLLLVVSMLSNPESALFVQDHGVFVSEIGKIGVEDGRITIVENLMGDKHVLVSKKLVDPRGLTYDYVNNNIIVADVDSLKVVDPKTGDVKILYGPDDFPVKPEFLNDVLWDNGVIYVTDTKLNKVFKIENGEIKELLTIQKANGLAIGNKGELYIASFADPQGKIYKYENGKLTVFIKEADLNGTDGLFYDKKRDFLIASGFWSGRLVLIEPSGKVINKIYGKMRHPADISYDPVNMYIFVPDMDRGMLFVYKLKDHFRNIQQNKEQPQGCSICGK